jgi:histidine triad (HIT) family protein
MNGDVEEEVPSEQTEGESPAAPQCPFCLIVEGKIETKIVYSDDRFLGILDINPANPGHILLFPKAHFTNLTDMGDDLVSRMFVVAKNLCNALLETLHAKGFNVFLANGQIAGQNVPHVILHLIPRFDQDGVSFRWKPKQMSAEEMQNISEVVKSFSFSVDKKPEVPKVFYELDEEERVA